MRRYQSLVLLVTMVCGVMAMADDKKVAPALRFAMKSLDGKPVELSKYQGQVVMVVNVATECGLTPQYEQLQALHEKYHSQGLAIIGVPCNQFGMQEPGSADDIQQFCKKNYGVSFDLLSKVDVNGANACDLYKYLKGLNTKPKGSGEVSWNFEKFLINRQGEVIARFEPRTKPDAPEVVKVLEAELAEVIPQLTTRRRFLAASCAGGATLALRRAVALEPANQNQGARKAQIAVTLDLEMSREYPRRGMLEWDYEKGNLDEATKGYAVGAARAAREHGGLIHFFCVGRVLEQPDTGWLKEIAAAGHPIGNHTYDHVYLLAKTADELQFRFRRAPWLVADKTVDQILRDNIRMTTAALQQRCGIAVNGFRTPGGFSTGLKDRADIQRLLLDLGFRWCSSLYPRHPTGPPRQEPTEEVYASIVHSQAEAQPFVYPSGLIEVPMSPISDVNAFRNNYWKLEWFLKAIRLSVEWAIENRAVFDFLAHPSCLVVEDPEFRTIRLICDLVKQAGERAEIVGLDQIAARIS